MLNAPLIYSWALIECIVPHLQFLFNNLVQPPKFLRPDASDTSVLAEGGNAERAEEGRALLSEETLEETATLPADLGTSGYDVVPPPSATSTHNKKST